MKDSSPLLQPLGRAIIFTALVAGTLDASAAMIQFVSVTGKNPEIVWRFVASGVFGKKAFTDTGSAIPVWGLLFHFGFAFIYTFLFYWICPRVSWTRKQPVAAGLIYGIIVWLIQTQVILRVSQIPPQHFVWKNAMIAMAIIIFCIGLPISLMAKKHYLYKK